MDLKIGDLTFDARPITIADMPELLFKAFERSRTQRVDNYYDCRDGGTFGKKKRLTIAANVVLAPYAATQQWPRSKMSYVKKSKAEIKDIAGSSDAVFRWMQHASGLSKGDALDKTVEAMFGSTPKFPIPYDAIVAAHPGFSLEIVTRVQYQFIALYHPKIAVFSEAMIGIGIAVGIENWVTYSGKCEGEDYVKFGVHKRNLKRDDVFVQKPPATDEEAQLRRELLQAKIDRTKAREDELRKKREELERRKAALPGE